MTGKTYQTTLLIRGDARNAVRTVQLTRGELEKLTGAQSKNVPVSQRMGQMFLRANTSVGRLTSGLQGLGGILGAVGLGAFVRKTLDSADSLASMRGQLKLVTDSQGELNQVYARALDLSNQTGAATESTVSLYARMARATEELNLSQDQLFTITQAVNQSFVVSGATAQESASATLQLSQGLAAGALRGEELNSVMENSPRLARALADGLGVSIGQLREMGKAGELTADAVTDALLDMAGEIDGEFQEMPMTIGRAMQSLSNSVNDALGDVDTSSLTSAVGEFQTLLADPAFRRSLSDLSTAVVSLVTDFARLTSEATRFAKFVGEELSRRINGAAFDDIPGMTAELERLEKRMENTRVKSTSGFREMADRAKELRRMIALASEEQERAALSAAELERANEEAAAAARRQAAAAAQQREENQRLASIGFAAAEGQLALAKASTIAAKDMAEAANTANVAQQALVDLGNQADPVAAAIERSGERIDDTFAGFFREMLREGKVSFDSLKDLALDTLAEIIYAYARNQVILSLGLGAGGAGAAVGVAGAGAGISSLFSSGVSGAVSAFGGGVGNFLQSGAGFFEGIGFNGGARFLTGLENNLASSAGGNLGLGAAGNIAAGFGGALLGNAVFGDTSGVGSTIGAVAGSFLPVPFLGTALGSFLGSGIESLFGGSDRQDISGVRVASGNRAAVGLSQGQSLFFDRGSSETDQAAQELAGTIGQLVNAIGGSSQDVLFNVGSEGGLYLSRAPGESRNAGPRFNGSTFNYGDDLDGFLNHAFDQLVEGANHLEPALRDLILAFDGTIDQSVTFAQSWMNIQEAINFDAVGAAIEDFTRAQEEGANTMMGAYQRSVSGARELVNSYDGTAEAAQALSQGLLVTQQQAYQLATAILAMNDQIVDAAAASAQSIRESVMTEEQRIASWTRQRDELRAQLETLTDPEQITEVSQEILRLNRQVFDSLGEDAQQSQAEAFATYAENTADIASEQYDEALQEVRETQEQIADQVSQILTAAAAQQQAAAQQFAGDVQTFGTYVNTLVANGVDVRVAVDQLGSEVNA